MDQTLRQKAANYITSNKVTIVNNPNSFKNKFFKPKANKMITVVTPAYNAEQFIEKTMDSVLAQTLNKDQIQYIIVDDCSSDHTSSIIREYASKYDHICFVQLHENSGSAGLPRNIGIELATSKYITFLDADDWLEEDGLERLCKILEETGDDYVVGKTIKYENSGQSIIGEFESISERRNVSPFAIPYFFYHMGPRARAVRLSLLNEHNIRFPEMKFGEDKSFFIEVFLHANSVSTTTAPIYYVNRTAENDSSLTKVTTALDKRKLDLKIVHYIKSLNLEVEKEKIILNRIYEYDILRTFDSMLFARSKDKKPFLEFLKETVATTTDLRYNFREEFKVPLYRTAIDLFMEGREDDFIKLFEWYKFDKTKKHVIKDSLAYYEVPFLQDAYRFIRIPMHARALDSYIINNQYVQTFEIYGDDINHIDSVLIRDRADYKNELLCDFHIQGNFGQFSVDFAELSKLNKSFCTVFVRFNGHQLINIKRIASVEFKNEDKLFNFYTSKTNNLSLSVK
ncbi:glycosyltransferase involved in cell wall biosynthesis [Planomicrobium soli]|uniref:Glycosyltransferase involved in cell wall biosynthesis n=1 Tax=Planomicrobium soli TaxID=1176648 RepID=A0A2P8H390_9BACL|nr:glycosyltransferase family 2 protein [Planomicrobium soli]PSL40667.1 glycosyltransferase involved in cell wall biosynthesis [Planomicrobium soli]